jgi:hypothetical protein
MKGTEPDLIITDPRQGEAPTSVDRIMTELTVHTLETSSPGARDKIHSCVEDIRSLVVKYGAENTQVAIAIIVEEMYRP